MSAATGATSVGGLPLTITDVTKRFDADGRSVEALTPITTTIRAGEFVCLLGPSGCGKSTLLSIIAGLEHATSGGVSVNGVDVRDPGPDRVLLFQDAALFPWLDVQRNVEFGMRQQGISPKTRTERARQLLETVGLSGFERSYAHQLSGGMRQRVAIARALAINPAILLMDEPFGALDALTRDRLQGELEAIWASTGKTVIFVTHNVREAVALGDRVLVFSARPGRILREFPIDLPRPRRLEDHALVDLSATILSVLRQDGTAR